MYRHSSIDWTEDWPVQSLGPRGRDRGIVDHNKADSPPEGVDTGLLGPASHRRDLLEAERRMKEREAQSNRAGAIQTVAWTRAQMAAAEAKAEAAEHKLAHDLNPLGRSARHARWRLDAARARLDMSTLAELAADAVEHARGLGVTAEEMR